jgi:hypothetical protein
VGRHSSITDPAIDDIGVLFESRTVVAIRGSSDIISARALADRQKIVYTVAMATTSTLMGEFPVSAVGSICAGMPTVWSRSFSTHFG